MALIHQKQAQLEPIHIVSYKIQMMEVRKTDEFDRWLDGMKDKIGKASTIARIRRLGLGNSGDSAPVGEGVSEMRIHISPGYRVYYKQTSKTIVLLLIGGNKASQTRDIARARQMAAKL